MIKEPITVRVLDDQDHVAGVIARYNLLAVPVVDDAGHLEGIVTVDDALDAVAPEAGRRWHPRRRRHGQARDLRRAAGRCAGQRAAAGAGWAGAHASWPRWPCSGRASSVALPTTTLAASRPTRSPARASATTCCGSSS